VLNRRALSTFALAIMSILLCGQGYSRLDPAQALLAKIGALPFGYGQHTLGGCLEAGCKCEVTTLNDTGPGSLRSCVESDVPKWVVFGEGGRGTIELETPLYVGSNTTIDGRGPLPVTIQRAVGHVMYIRDRENVIVNDLEFRLVPKKQRCRTPKTAADTIGCGGGIAISGKSRNVWIHQNQFARCGGKCVSVWTDGSRDAAAGGDLITISGNLFKDSFYGALVGANHDLKENQIPLMRVTFYRNVFDNIVRRSPRASELSRVHVLNNVVKNWGNNSCAGGEAFGASSKTGAQLFLENNLFSARVVGACKVATYIEGGYIKATGNVASNGAILRQKWPAGVFDPKKAAPEYYEYAPLPMTSEMQLDVENSVGPRLGGPVPEIP
jgi:pectate lyase